MVGYIHPITGNIMLEENKDTHNAQDLYDLVFHVEIEEIKEHKD